MLHANRLSIKEGATDVTIAGKSGGRKVICSPRALPIYEALVELAGIKKNYWAGIIVRAIDGLTSGRLHQDNIYIKETYNVAYGTKGKDKKDAFHLVLPGVKATLVQHPNGSYILQYINADLNYMKKQMEKKTPGLWEISKDSTVEPKFLADGMVGRKDYRPVVIPDMASDNVQDIAKATRDDLSKVNSTIQSMVVNNGFDLHHTPGTSGIVGMKKAKGALSTSKDQKIVESATLLANSMYKARSITGVLWFSDWGGSAVLTRAMQILSREKGITLKNHSIFMNRPTTPSKEAINLAKELGMEALGKGKETGLTLSEIKGHIFHNGVSKKTVKNVTGTTIGAAGAAFGIAGTAALAGPALTTVGIAGALVGLTGGLIHVGKTVCSGADSLKSKKYK